MSLSSPVSAVWSVLLESLSPLVPRLSHLQPCHVASSLLPPHPLSLVLSHALTLLFVPFVLQPELVVCLPAPAHSLLGVVLDEPSTKP